MRPEDEQVEFQDIERGTIERPCRRVRGHLRRGFLRIGLRVGARVRGVGRQPQGVLEVRPVRQPGVGERGRLRVRAEVEKHRQRRRQHRRVELGRVQAHEQVDVPVVATLPLDLSRRRAVEPDEPRRLPAGGPAPGDHRDALGSRRAGHDPRHLRARQHGPVVETPLHRGTRHLFRRDGTVHLVQIPPAVAQVRQETYPRHRHGAAVPRLVPPDLRLAGMQEGRRGHDLDGFSRLPPAQRHVRGHQAAGLRLIIVDLHRHR